MIKYSNIEPIDTIKIDRLVYRSNDYFSDWIEYNNGKLSIDFKCDKCDNSEVKICLHDYNEFSGLFDDKFLDKKSLGKNGGYFENEKNTIYSCNIDSFRLLKCNKCDTKYLIAFGYNEHQPSRDIYKLLSIFEIK